MQYLEFLTATQTWRESCVENGGGENFSPFGEVGAEVRWIGVCRSRSSDLGFLQCPDNSSCVPVVTAAMLEWC